MMGWWTGDLALFNVRCPLYRVEVRVLIGMLCVLHVLGSDMLFFSGIVLIHPCILELAIYRDYFIGCSLLLEGISYFTNLCLTGGAGLVTVATCTVMCIFSQTSAAHCFVKVESLGQGAAAPKPVVYPVSNNLEQYRGLITISLLPRCQTHTALCTKLCLLAPLFLLMHS